MLKKPFDDLLIEKVQRSDLDQLEKLFASAFAGEVDIRQIRRRIHRTKQFYYILQPLSKVSVWVKNHFNIYVVKISGQVAGFIQVSYLNPTQLHIDYIAFSKEYRGQGLGRWVLSKLLKSVVDANDQDVILEVRLDNPAYNLYKRLGFKQITEILHYEKTIGTGKASVQPQAHELLGFRELVGRDRNQLYRLYKESLPYTLRRVVKRNHSEFNPSMIVRQLDWAKNYLMRKRKTDYVVEQAGKIVALLTINSYHKAQSHGINLIIHRSYEDLRQAILSQAISLITAHNKQGVISTTIYSDDPSKQLVLEQLGFNKELAYYLMFRPSITKRTETIPVMPHGAQVSKQTSKKHQQGKVVD